jgi:hypothetical protein
MFTLTGTVYMCLAIPVGIGADWMQKRWGASSLNYLIAAGMMVRGLQVQPVHTQCSSSTHCLTCSDVFSSFFALGSHPPSYIRWIPSTIIYPLDPTHQVYAVGMALLGPFSLGMDLQEQLNNRTAGKLPVISDR